LLLIPKLTFIVDETSTTQLYTLNGYEINNFSDTYEESFLIGFVLPKNKKYKNIHNTFIDLVMDSHIFHEISPESYIYRTYESESQLDDIYFNSTRFVFGIIFHNSFFNYTIKIDDAFIPAIEEDPIPYYKQLISPGASSRSTYEVFFSPLQKAVDEAILKLVLNNKQLKYEVNLAQLAEPKHHCATEKAWEYNYTIGLLIGLFLFITKDIVKYIVDEKENGIKVSLSLMGINSSYVELSWVVLYCIRFLISIVLITFVITLIPIKANSFDPIMFLLIFGVYGLGCIGIGYLFSVLFQNVKRAYILYITTIIFIFVSSQYIFSLDKEIRILTSVIFIPVSVISIIGEINKTIGIYNHINYKDLFHGDIFLFYCLLVGATLLYYIIPYALDKYIMKAKLEKEYTKEYQPIKVLNIERPIKIPKHVEDFQGYNNLPVSISINDLSKKLTYANKNQISIVDNLNIKIYEDEIFGIFGNESSGKNALMHMMLGNIKSSTGEILYHDKNIYQNSKIKKDIGNIKYIYILIIFFFFLKL